jgi:SAM-dependent methyltransferase
MAASAADERRSHWERVYSERVPDEVSWYQERPEPSLTLIGHARLGAAARILDVGGGASTLVDHLLDVGFRDLTVLDIASPALERARARLGQRAAEVRWLVGDVTAADLDGPYALWHDRAVFHFLVAAELRVAYRAQLLRHTRPGAEVILGTFSLDGPERCSGLPVARYSADTLTAELGSGFEFEEAMPHEHRTPAGKTQRFTFCRFRCR